MTYTFFPLFWPLHQQRSSSRFALDWMYRSCFLMVDNSTNVSQTSPLKNISRSTLWTLIAQIYPVMQTKPSLQERLLLPPALQFYCLCKLRSTSTFKIIYLKVFDVTVVYGSNYLSSKPSQIEKRLSAICKRPKFPIQEKALKRSLLTIKLHM